MSMLRFSDLGTLKVALASGLVPSDVANSPAKVAFDEPGAVFVRFSGKLPRETLKELKKLGIVSDRVQEDSVLAFERASCWPQLIPLERDPSTILPAPNLPVFFKLAEGQVGDFIGEMLRLGVDRQSFRWLGGSDRRSALLRVVGPPYFSLLRAIDRADRSEGPVAYVEQAPRVLIEFGYRHALASQIVPPPGRIVLIREPKAWQYAQEGPFRDVYGSLEFSIPKAPVSLRAIEVEKRYPVSLRLARSSASEPSELWVLRVEAERQVEALVDSADDRLLARLSFAVSEGSDGPMVVIRVRPSKLPPPPLVLDGVGFRPFLRLPHLFLPTGSRLHPPLRRDAVSNLLTSDPEQVTWLSPTENGGFVPESLPDSAFRPLDRWVDYILDREHKALQAWVDSAQFDFESFACGEASSLENAPRPPKRKKRKPIEGALDESKPSTSPTVPEPTRERTIEPIEPLKVIEPEAAVIRLGELETLYRELEGPPEAAERQALLIEMATLNAGLDRASDASACWSLAVWEIDSPPSRIVNDWSGSVTSPVSTAQSMDQLLASEFPMATELRNLAIWLIHRAFGLSKTTHPGDRLDRIPQFLEQHEGALPVRLVWLAWLSLFRLSRGDVLALARARDRILERLHRGGLSPELDLPGFLRFGGGVSAERTRLIRDRLTQLHVSALVWVDRGDKNAPHTRLLANLIFAYGMARLGDRDDALQLVKAAQVPTSSRDIVLLLLSRAFEYRIHQVLEGKPLSGPLPADLLQRLERMGNEGTQAIRDRETEDRYKIDRLRNNSRILEPHERINAYRYKMGSETGQWIREIAEWPDVADRNELATRVAQALTADLVEKDGRNLRCKIVKVALEVAYRLGEASAVGVLAHVEPTVASMDLLTDKAELLEKGLRLAAHFDREEQVRSFVNHFESLLVSKGTAMAALEPVLGQCFRGLRKLGLGDEIERLLGRISETVLKSRNLAVAGPRSGPQAIEWSKTLKVLLQVASVWFDIGEGDRADSILEEVRGLLLEGDLKMAEQTSLACAFVRSLAFAPPEFALPRMAEVFERLDRVFDTSTTMTHYSWTRLNVVEAVVSTLVSDDFTHDRSSRNQLENDEFLVRRRIHRDVRAALDSAG